MKALRLELRTLGVTLADLEESLAKIESEAAYVRGLMEDLDECYKALTERVALADMGVRPIREEGKRDQ